MSWNIEFTDEFEHWWDGLSSAEQETIFPSVTLLERYGTALGFPHSSALNGSRHGQMRELRVQYRGKPIRILYAFDPRRCAILLIGGNKAGQKRWYEKFVPIADRLYDEHLDELRKEGRI
jgi:hypothetical protein